MPAQRTRVAEEPVRVRSYTAVPMLIARRPVDPDPYRCSQRPSIPGIKCAQRTHPPARRQARDRAWATPEVQREVRLSWRLISSLKRCRSNSFQARVATCHESSGSSSIQRKLRQNFVEFAEPGAACRQNASAQAVRGRANSGWRSAELRAGVVSSSEIAYSRQHYWQVRWRRLAASGLWGAHLADRPPEAPPAAAHQPPEAA